MSTIQKARCRRQNCKTVSDPNRWRSDLRTTFGRKFNQTDGRLESVTHFPVTDLKTSFLNIMFSQHIVFVHNVFSKCLPSVLINQFAMVSVIYRHSQQFSVGPLATCLKCTDTLGGRGRGPGSVQIILISLSFPLQMMVNTVAVLKF